MMSISRAERAMLAGRALRAFEEEHQLLREAVRDAEELDCAEGCGPCDVLADLLHAASHLPEPMRKLLARRWGWRRL
jgi:hypothetical protein